MGWTCEVSGCKRTNRAYRVATLCRTHYRRKTAGEADWDRPIRDKRPAGAGYKHGSGYVLVYDRDRGRAVLEHRMVMESLLDRELLSHENVHHKNGDRSDNRPENLELWTRGQPAGQRVDDLLDFVVTNYADLLRKRLGP